MCSGVMPTGDRDRCDFNGVGVTGVPDEKGDFGSG